MWRNHNKWNITKAGIDEKTVRYDWLRSKSKEEQIKYLGSKNRWALVESGVITEDEDLSKLYKTTTTSSGKTVTTRKTLKELENNGIITIRKFSTGTDKSGKKKIHDTLKHSTIGDFTGLKNPKKPAGGKNGGRMLSGGHSQSNIKLLDEKGIEYQIVKTHKNGVRVGGVNDHKRVEKNLTGLEQAWFPDNWTDDDVLVAGTYVANKFEKTIEQKMNDVFVGNKKYAVYNGVVVCVFEQDDGNIGSIFPDLNQRDMEDIDD